MPFFSVIIPTYNRSGLLKNLLELFMQQSFQDYEIIVVDDGSTDNSEEVVKSFADKRLSYFKKDNGGVSSARNFGITKAKGKYINFFDSDDIVYPNHLAEAYTFFNSQPSSKVLIFDYDWGDADKKKSVLISNHYKNPNKAIRFQNYISTNGIFIEKDLAKKHRFIEGLSISEDWQYWIRLSVLTKFAVVNISTSYIVEHKARGINKISLASIIDQKELFISSLKNDPTISALEDFNLDSIISHFDSFVALNAALVGEKKTSIRYFHRSILLYFPSLFSRRSLAIIKHLLFSK